VKKVSDVIRLRCSLGKAERLRGTLTKYKDSLARPEVEDFGGRRQDRIIRDEFRVRGIYTKTASLLRAQCETRDEKEKEIREGQEDASTTVNNASREA
jgi:hypothetical protein